MSRLNEYLEMIDDKHKYELEFKNYKDFNVWRTKHLKDGGKDTDKIKILVYNRHKEGIIYSSPLDVLHSYEEDYNEEDETNETQDDELFVLGYWVEPYSGRKEYFWMRDFYDRKEALAAGKRKQERGQPKTFRDWVAGQNKVIKGADKFLVAAKKVGLNPRME